MDLAVRLSFASDSIGRGFTDALLSTQFRHGLHNPMVAVAATAPQSLFIEALFDYSPKLPGWCRCTAARLPMRAAMPSNSFSCAPSEALARESRQRVRVLLLCVICGLSCVDYYEKAQNFSACGGHLPPAAPAAGWHTDPPLQPRGPP